MDDSVEPACAT